MNRPPRYVADRLHKSLKTLANWRSQKRGPDYIKIYGRILYTDEALAAFEQKHTHRVGEVA